MGRYGLTDVAFADDRHEAIASVPGTPAAADHAVGIRLDPEPVRDFATTT